MRRLSRNLLSDLRPATGRRHAPRRLGALAGLFALAVLLPGLCDRCAEAATPEPPRRPVKNSKPQAAPPPSQKPAAPTQPKPESRPPAEQAAPPAPAAPPARQPADVSPDELTPYNLPPATRQRMRLCGERWRDLKMEGRSVGLTWRSFAEKCLPGSD